jgi:hypothetical protein
MCRVKDLPPAEILNSALGPTAPPPGPCPAVLSRAGQPLGQNSGARGAGAAAARTLRPRGARERRPGPAPTTPPRKNVRRRPRPTPPPPDLSSRRRPGDSRARPPPSPPLAAAPSARTSPGHARPGVVLTRCCCCCCCCCRPPPPALPSSPLPRGHHTRLRVVQTRPPSTSCTHASACAPRLPGPRRRHDPSLAAPPPPPPHPLLSSRGDPPPSSRPSSTRAPAALFLLPQHQLTPQPSGAHLLGPRPPPPASRAGASLLLPPPPATLAIAAGGTRARMLAGHDPGLAETCMIRQRQRRGRRARARPPREHHARASVPTSSPPLLSSLQPSPPPSSLSRPAIPAPCAPHLSTVHVNFGLPRLGIGIGPCLAFLIVQCTQIVSPPIPPLEPTPHPPHVSKSCTPAPHLPSGTCTHLFSRPAPA